MGTLSPDSSVHFFYIILFFPYRHRTYYHIINVAIAAKTWSANCLWFAYDISYWMRGGCKCPNWIQSLELLGRVLFYYFSCLKRLKCTQMKQVRFPQLRSIRRLYREKKRKMYEWISKLSASLRCEFKTNCVYTTQWPHFYLIL